MELTKRQAEIAEQVAKGFSNKHVAKNLHISIETVRQHIRQAAERLPGEGWPRHKLTLWFFHVERDD